MPPELLDLSEIRGFNYQPSYGTSGFELWQRFDVRTIQTELDRGRNYFPGMNALRWWLSWDSFIRNPDRFAERFELTLQMAADRDLVVMPVLFNRWHDSGTDYGGIYIDHFLPGVSWVHSDGMFDRYLEAIVGEHAHDRRVFCWDICNEPFSYAAPLDQIPEQIVETEFAWLESMYRGCKAFEPDAPVGISIHPLHGEEGIRQIEPISEVLLIHPYGAEPELLDSYERVAAEAGKQLLVTEAGWGAVDDAERVENIRRSLSEFSRRGIGWLVYLLHHSMISDAHRPEHGPVDRPGFHFIEADGALRPGHEVFNEF